MKKLFINSIFLSSIFLFSSSIFGQEVRHVKRTLDGGVSIIRETIDQNKELNFYRDWNKIAKLKSGIGETVEFFPVILSIPEKKIELHGLQLDIEVKPQGKRYLRLSLLSGGERSLAAVAFLVALFKARPSPFYILDEVEAALDDTNLGRLLELYEELRVNSQLIIVTHQKKTMEICDSLYGVSMRGDGISTVVSQRIREVREDQPA